MSKYKDATYIEGFGSELILFRRSDLGNDVWHFRANIDGVRGYIRRSTKETDLTLAKRTATNAYHTLMGQKAAGLRLGKKKVSEVVNQWFEHLEQSGTKQTSRLNYMKSTWSRYMGGYFGNLYISTLTDEIVDGYWEYRKGFYVSGEGKGRSELNDRRLGSKTTSSKNINPRPKFGTLRAEASILNEFFKWCARDAQGYTAKPFKLSAKDATTMQERKLSNRRPTFTRNEWNTISTNLFNYAHCKGTWTGKRVNAWHRKRRQMFRVFVLLLASTGLRVGEARSLRWKNIIFRPDVVRQIDVLNVEVEATKSKVSESRTAVGFSELISDVVKEWKSQTDYPDDNDLVFYSLDEDGCQKETDFAGNWKLFLEQQNAWKNNHGENRPLYSLRHLYATMRLEEGTEVYFLAKLMGTSVQQIERHYGHVATESLIVQGIKGGNRKDREEARDLRDAAELIRLYRQGKISTDQITRKIISIANTGR